MKPANLLWAALAVLVVSGAVLGWTLHHKSLPPLSKAAHSATPPASAQEQPPARPQDSPVLSTIAQGNGAGAVKVRPAEDQDQSYLSITLTGKGEMLLQNPQAKSLGFDPESHKLVQQMANGSYDEGDLIDDDDDASDPPQAQPAPSSTPEPPATLSGLEDNGFRRIDMIRPMPGKYLLKVITRDETSYSLSIKWDDRSLTASYADFTKVPVSPRDVHVYQFEIPPDSAGELKAERR